MNRLGAVRAGLRWLWLVGTAYLGKLELTHVTLVGVIACMHSGMAQVRAVVGELESAEVALGARLGAALAGVRLKGLAAVEHLVAVTARRRAATQTDPHSLAFDL